MALSQKGISFLEPLSKLQLHNHSTTQELDMKNMNDPSNQSFLSSPYNLPFIQLPQTRKFLTLSSAHTSADSDSRRNSPPLDAEIEPRRSPILKHGLKGMDLVAMEGSHDDELKMARDGSLPEEQVMEKKKLLAELAGMNSNSEVFHKSFKGFHQSSKGIRESSVIERVASNPSRICRFCRREFPSGRALGGHMRVHGALLDAHTSSLNMIKQENQKQKQNHEGKVLSNRLHKGKDALVAADLSASSELEEREQAGMLCSGEGERASSEDREIKTCSEVNSESLYQKLDVNSAHTRLSREEERNHDVLDLSYFDYSSGYGKSNNLQLLAGDCVEYALSFDSKKHPGLYELRHNPKPNQRFKRERYAAQMNHSTNANCQSNPTPAPSPSAGDQTPSTSPSPERARTCSECGKVFFSWKALFGHMRCHPEREWRGIQRPDSSVEFDHTARMTARRPAAEDPMAELGYGACNKSNCMKVESTKETTQRKEEIAHANMANSQEEEKTASFVMHRKGGTGTGTGTATSVELPKGPGTAIDTDCGKHEENKDKKDVVQCTKSKHEALMHAHIEEMTDDWSPIWSSAGKRSKRRRLSTHTHPALTSETISNEIGFDKKGPEFKDLQEDLDMANCLVLLSSAGKNMQEINKTSMESTEESAFSHPGKAQRTLSKVDQWEGASDTGDEAIEDSTGELDDYEAEEDEAQNNGSHVAPVLVNYQCSTCKKCFNSHQALGGHRASHRKMKGCFARMKSLAAPDAHESSEENDSEEAYFLSSQHIKGQVMKHINLQEDEEIRATLICNNSSYKTQLKKKFKGHECSICHRIFATGQALGGHKRCHWTGEKVPGADTVSVASSSTNNKKQESSPLERGEWGYRNSSKGPQKHAKEDVIDLNLPAPLDEDEEVGYDAACGDLMYAKLTPPMQTWNPTKVAQIPQVCSMQTL